jgi:acyl-CoA oxidase
MTIYSHKNTNLFRFFFYYTFSTDITMMQVRAYIIHSSNDALAMACTIAIRYSTIRRQGYNTDDTDKKKWMENAPNEIQVLDYRQQQYRLLPLLAASYAIFFSGKHVLARLKDIENQLVSGSTAITKTVVGDIHATTSALKSYATAFTADGIEDCRKACGGHGFLVSSGLVELSNTYLQSCTVEGDNYMLPQQVVKVLLKLVGAMQSGNAGLLKDHKGTDMEYLIAPLTTLMKQNGGVPNKSSFVFPTTNENAHDFLDISTIMKAFQHRSACLLLDVAMQLASNMAKSSAQQAWNNCLLDMARASRAHASYILLRDFYNGLKEEERKSSASCLGPNEIRVLSQCLTLLGLYWMDQYLEDFLQNQSISPASIPHLRQAILDVMTLLRPDAVGLCDARDYSDFRLKSALGKYDGDVYPAIMESARRDPLNRNSADGGVGMGYDESLKKLIVGGIGEYKKGLSGTVSRL